MATLKELREERRLVKYAVKGDKRSLERLIVKNVNFCYSISIIFLEDNKLAKKAIEDTFSHVYSHIQDLYNPKGFKVWLYDILKQSIDKLRQKGKVINKGDIVFDSTSSIDYLTLYKINPHEMKSSEKLLSMVRKLPDVQKEIIALVDFEGLSCTDASLLLDMDLAIVRTELYEAKNTLKQIFMFKSEPELDISENIQDPNLDDSEKGQFYGIDQFGV